MDKRGECKNSFSLLSLVPVNVIVIIVIQFCYCQCQCEIGLCVKVCSCQSENLLRSNVKLGSQEENIGDYTRVMKNRDRIAMMIE